jgi:hypothetical protein
MLGCPFPPAQVQTRQQGLTVCNGPDYPKHAYPPLNAKEVKVLRDRIRQQYRVRLILDNLPITTFDLESELELVLPGFEVGYRVGDKYYVNNHLMFKVLVHETNGQYTMSKQAEAEVEAAAAVEVGYSPGLECGGSSARRRRLRAPIRCPAWRPGLKTVAGGKASCLGRLGTHVLPVGFVQAGGRRLLKDEDKPKEKAKKAGNANKRGKPEPRVVPPGQKMYMVVGFEVLACSIKREPGQPINKNLRCPESPDDANAPEPQEVKKGERELAGCIRQPFDSWWLPHGQRLLGCGLHPQSCRIPGAAACTACPPQTHGACAIVCCLVHPRTRTPSPPGSPLSPPPNTTPGAEIVYAYDVFWDTSDITWSSRWDSYLRMPGGKVHWFSILNSLMVVVVMSCIVAMIMMRTIRRDLQRYEQLLVDGGQGNDVEESGWKMVSGDVFRPPANPLSLCVQIGSGVQILCSGFITLLFAALGFLSPASRGSLLTAALVMYLLLSVAAGYAAVCLWGLVNRSYEGWFKVCWRVACFFPGVTVAVMTFLNLFLWATGSSGAIPLGFFFSIIFLWLLISIPLSYSGGIIAAKQEIRQYPTRTNQIPRHIPPPHWASHPLVLFFAAGLLPFGTIFVELYFAMTSMWQVGGA